MISLNAMHSPMGGAGPTCEGSCQMCALGRNEVGCVCALDADPCEARRLAELGLVQGAVIRMIRPGRACIVGLRQARLSLGSTIQRNVKVIRISESAAGGAPEASMAADPMALAS